MEAVQVVEAVPSTGARFSRQGGERVALNEALKTAAQKSYDERDEHGKGSFYTLPGFDSRRIANGQLAKLRQWANGALGVAVYGKVFQDDDDSFGIEFRVGNKRDVTAEEIRDRTEKANATRAAKRGS